MKALVIDSGALIKGGGGGEFERSSDKVYTVKEVVAEIKDSTTRQRLQVLPYQLELREPSQEAIQHVSSFAKQTGDYHVLSQTDIKVVALTYQLECELSEGHGAQLRMQPIKQAAVPIETHHHTAGVIGMYYGPNYDTKSVSVSPSMSSTVSPSDSPPMSSSPPVMSSSPPVMFSSPPVLSSSPPESVPDHDKESLVPDDEAEDDWITPDNLHIACEQMGGAMTAAPEGVAVGCITTDYSMQNVLLQMGLHVLSLDGLLIKQIRYYKMYCKACNKVTGIASSKFCPNCGNPALIRVKAVTDDQGHTQYSPLSMKQFSRKGLKYSLPKPKGGRHANNPITCPDQKLTNQRATNRKEKIDIFSPEFVARSSPFAVHDVTSRGAVGGFNKRHVDSRNNPNAVKRKGKRKK